MLVFLTLTLAAGGAFFAIEVFTSSTEHKETVAPPSTAFAVGEQVATSFGSVVVEHVENLSGLSAQDLAGVTHGIQNLVSEGQAQIQVSILLTNRSRRAISYEPAQFRLIAEKSDEPIYLSGATIHPGTPNPNTSIEATLSFVVPLDGSRLWMQFYDFDSSKPVAIALGQVDQIIAPEVNGNHTH